MFLSIVPDIYPFLCSTGLPVEEDHAPSPSASYVPNEPAAVDWNAEDPLDVARNVICQIRVRGNVTPEAYIPGDCDGGARRRRFKPQHPQRINWSTRSTANTTLALTAVGELIKKAKHPGMSQELIQDNLYTMSTAILNCPQLPSSHHQLLTLLEDQGLLPETSTIVYMLCKFCFTMYRGPEEDDTPTETCRNPGCGQGRANNTMEFHYRYLGNTGTREVIMR